MSLKESEQVHPLRSEDRHGRRATTRSKSWRAAWRSPITRSSASACSTGLAADSDRLKPGEKVKIVVE